ncbi:hypothetical protein AB6A23_18500 [Paenibacillus tarimensis]
MMRRNVWVITVTFIIFSLGINNAVTYFFTKRSLEDSLNHQLDSAAAQIEISVENSRLGAEKYQELIGHQLRSVAIAAQYALDPDIEKVTNEQLAELSDKLGVIHITLLKQTENDIILAKSSDPKQLGLSTSTWTPWHKAFKQLFEEHNVSIGWGQSLRNFWTGPFEVATSDTSKVRKWGYYNDGTTNYIIDPYVSYDMQREYEEITGANKLIGQIMKENPSILQITGINPKTFPVGGLKTKTLAGEELEHITTQPIIFGSYQNSEPDDVANVMKAYETKEPVSYNTRINGKPVLKRFIPVKIDAVASIVDLEGNPVDYYILSIIHDYKFIQEKLNRQFLIVATVTALTIVIVLLALNWCKRSRRLDAGHDNLMNRLKQIRALAEADRIDELKAYTESLERELKR